MVILYHTDKLGKGRGRSWKYYVFNIKIKLSFRAIILPGNDDNI